MVSATSVAETTSGSLQLALCRIPISVLFFNLRVWYNVVHVCGPCGGTTFGIPIRRRQAANSRSAILQGAGAGQAASMHGLQRLETHALYHIGSALHSRKRWHYGLWLAIAVFACLKSLKHPLGLGLWCSFQVTGLQKISDSIKLLP